VIDKEVLINIERQKIKIEKIIGKNNKLPEYEEIIFEILKLDKDG